MSEGKPHRRQTRALGTREALLEHQPLASRAMHPSHVAANVADTLSPVAHTKTACGGRS
jgi:hypothetical protein